MRNLYFLIFLISIITITACYNESYEPAGVPKATTIDDFFPDTIDNMGRETYLKQFVIQECNYSRVFASYGDSSEIILSIAKAETDKCAALLFKHTIKEKKQNGYKIVLFRKDMALAKKGDKKELYWYKHEWFFSIESNKEYFSQAAYNFKYVIVRR